MAQIYYLVIDNDSDEMVSIILAESMQEACIEAREELGLDRDGWENYRAIPCDEAQVYFSHRIGEITFPQEIEKLQIIFDSRSRGFVAYSGADVIASWSTDDDLVDAIENYQEAVMD